MAADAPDGAPLPLMDPALLLSLVPRLQEIGRLLDQVRVAPIEQSVTMEPPTRDPAATGAAPPSEPLSSSLALGTVNENDDDWDPWIASDGAGASTSHIPAALQTQLAQEATALQRTLAQAHAALDAAPGADMSIDDQVDLLDRLGAYRACQAYTVWTASVASVCGPVSMAMDESTN
ncbi:hypothetical protein MEQU1_000442 [Malassezia equina]|uniref:Uncharacterized protein n=1 Tax=Malassezia equina TaxID=1381935 RepID=A0AAF0IXH9_9BASI|nr:hypothetical protein MEQU1_000442 [Malassezia equina]